ncbi:MAG: hypothetical protein Unbinned6284contig1001_31 [Prokaryotic dsDNA virus sp.]|nr:MAG: hypothetical protein Unbinned6284contig1001_31 [Prokaryotic dsDNA virus sp.]|tara:strand:+ start:400 stop:558 length:159 start_codon:yes stop_codon:yes gene_type:complete
MKNSTFCFITGAIALAGMLFEDNAIYKAACLVCVYISISAIYICSAIENKEK